MNQNTLKEYDAIIEEAQKSICDGVDPVIVQTTVIMKLQSLILKRVDWLESVVAGKHLQTALDKAITRGKLTKK